MANSIAVWLGPLIIIILVAPVAFIAVGMVLYHMPGMLSLGQRFMRVGGTLALILIFTAAILNATVYERDGVSWTKIVLVLVFAFVAFCWPWLWRRFIRRG
jgi:hypothetical protein